MPADGGRYGHNSGADGIGMLGRSLLRREFAELRLWPREDGRTSKGKTQRAALAAGLIEKEGPFFVLTEKGKEFINAGR